MLPRLPNLVPTHWNAAGQVNGWTLKDQLHWVLFGVPLAFYAVFFAIGSIASRLTKDPVKARLQSFQPLRGLMVLGVCVVMGATLLIPTLGPGVMQGAVAFLLLCLFTGIFLLARDAARLLKDAPDASNYRWGVFYSNPQDPRLWVEKRIGIGWTLNYGRSAAWWITALILLPVVIVLGGVLFLVKTGR
jgi:uncharacterized membrane protein